MLLHDAFSSCSGRTRQIWQTGANTALFYGDRNGIQLFYHGCTGQPGGSVRAGLSAAHVRRQLGPHDSKSHCAQCRAEKGPERHSPLREGRHPARSRAIAGLGPLVPPLLCRSSGRSGVQPLQGAGQRQRSGGGQCTPRSAAGRGQRNVPPAELPVPAGNSGQHGPLHRPVRDGLGHHEFLPLHRDAQDGLPRHGGPRHLRSAGRHGHRPACGRARHHRLQHFHGQNRSGGHPAGQLRRRLSESCAARA